MTELTRTESGLDAIASMFAKTEAEGRAAFIPYFPVGYPSYDESLDAFTAMAEVGVDGFEIGMSFSDPLADGPTIQAATQVALEKGANINMALQAVRDLRGRGLTQPMLMFGYLNPVIAYGIDQFVKDAKAAGADGLIIPDLPPEEAHLFNTVCQAENMAQVFLLAPTSNAKRIKLVTATATGFIYLVSVTGITGARQALPDTITDYIGHVRAATDKPLALGFGISTPEQAKTMNGLVNGFIVGSALVKAASEGVEAVKTLAKSLRDALD